jgi:hypothetical protein
MESPSEDAPNSTAHLIPPYNPPRKDRREYTIKGRGHGVLVRGRTVLVLLRGARILPGRGVAQHVADQAGLRKLD